MKLHGYFWFQFEMSETSGFTPLQCWRGNLVCGAENKEKLPNRNISNKLSFPLIVFGFGTKPSTLTLVLLPPLDLSISMLCPSPPGLYYSLEGGILLLTALHLFDSFSLLSYSRSVCSWGFSLDYYVENHWIKLSDCRNEPSRWFLCFTIWRCCRYSDGNIMCS